MIVLTTEQKALFEKWVIENIDERIVPEDEGNDLALMYNMVHLIRGDGELYDYKDHQDHEIASYEIPDCKEPDMNKIMTRVKAGLMKPGGRLPRTGQ